MQTQLTIATLAELGGDDYDDAIRFCVDRNIPLHCHSNPMEEGRNDIGADDALDIAREDPSLVYITVYVEPCSHGCGELVTEDETLGGDDEWLCADCYAGQQALASHG